MISLNLQTPTKEQRSNPTAPLSVGWHNLFDHGYSDAGVDVNPHSVMQSSPAAAASVRLISSSIASLPLILYAKNGSSKTELTEHPVYSLLRYEPNPESDIQTLLGCLVQDVLLRGNGYLEITRTGTRISGLWYVAAEHVRVYRDKNSDLQYEVTVGTNRRTLPPSSIVHVTGQPSRDGVQGLSVLQTSKEIFAQSIALTRHTNLYFKNVSQPTGILSTTDKLKPEDRNMIRDSWEKLVGGSSKFRTAVLDSSLTYTAVNTTDNVQSDAVRTSEWNRQSISSLFGVPPSLISSEARLSGESGSSLAIAFIEYGLKGITKKIETSLLRRLFPGEMNKYAVSFNLMDMLKSDPAQMLAALSVARNSASLSTDELREMQNLSPVGGSIGQTILCPVNLTSTERVLNGDIPNPKIAPAGSNEGQQNE